jgi:drug/metabolite transporter (DMT)-like permease
MRHFFDVRNIIGALLGIYGVVLTVAGFAPGLLGDHAKVSTDNRVDLYVGTDANWWVGLALIAVAIMFISWALLRPIKDSQTPPQPTGSEH